MSCALRYITPHHILDPSSRTEAHRKRIWIAAYRWPQLRQERDDASAMTALSEGLFKALTEQVAPAVHLMTDMLLDEGDPDYMFWLEQAGSCLKTERHSGMLVFDAFGLRIRFELGVLKLKSPQPLQPPFQTSRSCDIATWMSVATGGVFGKGYVSDD